MSAVFSFLEIWNKKTVGRAHLGLFYHAVLSVMFYCVLLSVVEFSMCNFFRFNDF